MNPLSRAARLILTVLLLSVTTLPALAHCDAEDGPVIQDARIALASGSVAPVLKWIGADDEAAIRALFAQVVVVRKGGDEAKAVADQLFFETLVRLHRAGEGAGFDGIQPAGNQEPYVARIDQALAANDGDAVADAIAKVVRQEVASRFTAATTAAATKDASPEAGRAYVASYVELVHFIKGIHEAVVAGGTHAHGEAGKAPEAHGAAHHTHGGAN